MLEISCINLVKSNESLQIWFYAILPALFLRSEQTFLRYGHWTTWALCLKYSNLTYGKILLLLRSVLYGILMYQVKFKRRIQFELFVGVSVVRA